MSAQEELEARLATALKFYLHGLGDDAGLLEMAVNALVQVGEEEGFAGPQHVEECLAGYLPEVESLSEDDRMELCEDLLRSIDKRFPRRAAVGDDSNTGSESGSEGIGEGLAAGRDVCLMCKRQMPLTKHHLMPRSTHKRYKKRGYTDEALKRTVDICRPCHSAVHRTHDAAALAEKFYSLERLLADEQVSRFVAWARKQRVTTKRDADNPLLHYRR